MTKPAILHICLSQGWGGLEMYPIRIGKELLDSNYEVYGLCVSGTQVAKGMQQVGLETFEVKSKNTLIISQLVQLNKWLKERNVEVIHCHKSGDTLVSALLNLIHPRRSLFTEHMGVTRPKKDLYHKWVYSHIDQVLSISNETYQRNLKALPVPNSKIERLWLGTHIPDTPIVDNLAIAEIKAELGLAANAKVIGSLGRVCLGKGQMDLLEAFNLIKNEYVNTHLLIVGGLDVSEGSDNSFVETLQARVIELELTERVHFTGFRKDIDRMLAAMDIVCLPYYNEAFGLTAIEAMSARKAIVGANTGALPEILEGVALLCNPQSKECIAQAISQYLDNPQLIERNAHNAYQRSLDEFSMDTHISKLTYHYTKDISPIEQFMSPSFKLRIRNKFRVSKCNQVNISKNAKVRGCKISIKGRNNQLIIEDGVNLRGSFIEIDGIGCRVHISKNCIIGDNCYFSARENNISLILGEDCMLSRNVKLMTSDGHNILKNQIRINPAQSITIGNQVWLTDNVTVLKGTTVGDGSVVGINSTLTKSIDRNTIAVGNPAKVVSNNIQWQKELTY